MVGHRAASAWSLLPRMDIGTPRRSCRAAQYQPGGAVVLDGPTTGPAFLAYVEQFLAPTLRPGEVVVMDNLADYKAAGVETATGAVGASVLYLPPDP